MWIYTYSKWRKEISSVKCVMSTNWEKKKKRKQILPAIENIAKYVESIFKAVLGYKKCQQHVTD